MIANFKFNFSAGSINNQYMLLSIGIENKTTKPIHVADKFTFATDVRLPAEIEFHLNGRLENDTVVHNGEIVADKFIKLESLEIDGFFIESWQLPEEFFFFNSSENTNLFTAYWARNGVAKLIIDKDDPALWLLDCSKII